MNIPRHIPDEAALETVLSTPTPETVEFFRQLEGDLIILGIAGKMGLTLGQMAVRAARAAGTATRVLGVSRFSDPGARAQLEAHGLETLACDLLEPAAVAALPRVANVIYMAGRKFGTQGSEALTWAMNTLAPANVARHFAGSRIVAFSTGCVYPLVPLASGGCAEDELPVPVGEYAQACLGRERIFDYFSRTLGTPTCLYRLNYAIDLRYGVLHDLAQSILRGAPVDLTVPHVNVIWQGDANNMALRALAHCQAPAAPLNITGPETLSIRTLATRLAHALGKPVTFTGQDSGLAYLNNASHAMRLFGYPRVSVEQMLLWTADWLLAGGRSLGKPTHYEVNTGSY